MQDYQWVSGKSVVSEDETSSTATHAVLQVLPVTQRVDRLVLADLVINRFREQVYINKPLLHPLSHNNKLLVIKAPPTLIDH